MSLASCLVTARIGRIRAVMKVDYPFTVMDALVYIHCEVTIGLFGVFVHWSLLLFLSEFDLLGTHFIAFAALAAYVYPVFRVVHVFGEFLKEFSEAVCLFETSCDEELRESDSAYVDDEGM